MSRPARRQALVQLICATVVVSAGMGQDPGAEPSADSLASDSTAVTRFVRPILDPRITLLRDTLGEADTLKPRFTDLPELYPVEVIDPYSLDLPGLEPEWSLVGDQLLGRGAFNLLDVIESETLMMPHDLGGGGMPAFMGTAFGSQTNIEVFIDGVPVKDPLSVNWDLRRMSLEAIARVAYYPGAQSAAFGGGATGGVLWITTRRSLAPSARSMLAFTVGSFDTETFAGNFGRPVADGGDVFVAANFDATDGFLRLGDFTRNQFLLRFGWALGDRHRIEISRVSDGFSGDANRTNISGEQDQDSRTINLAYKGSIAGLGVRGHWYGTTQDIGQNFTYREVTGLFGEGRRAGLRATLDWSRGPLVSWGQLVREEVEVQSTHPSFLRSDGSSVFEPAAPGSAAVAIENPRTHTEVAGGFGLRTLDDRLAGNAAVRRLAHGDAADDGVAWSFEAVGRPTDELAIRGAVGRGVRPVDAAGQALLRVFADDDIEIHPGAPARPERLEAWTTVRGVAEWSRAGWRFAGAGFSSRGRDVSLWLPSTSWLYFDRGDLENVRLGTAGFNTYDVVDLTVSGIEGEIRGPLPWGLRGRLAARRIDATEDGTGARIPYVPESQLLGQVRYAARHFPSRDLLLEARLTGRFVGERTTLDPEQALPSYFATDLLVQGTVINFTVFVAFKNLGGQAYRTEDAFFLPTREGFFGINWRFHN